MLKHTFLKTKHYTHNLIAFYIPARKKNLEIYSFSKLHIVFIIRWCIYSVTTPQKKYIIPTRNTNNNLFICSKVVCMSLVLFVTIIDVVLNVERSNLLHWLHILITIIEKLHQLLMSIWCWIQLLNNKNVILRLISTEIKAGFS